jgi:hypothetical protein
VQHPLIHGVACLARVSPPSGDRRVECVTEGHERARGDQSHHFPLERPLTAALIEHTLQGEAAGDIVGVPLDRHRLTLAF